MSLTLIDGPTVEPLTVAEVRDRLSIGDELSDTALQGLITAARNIIDGADGWLGRALITQTWELRLDQFPVPNCYNSHAPSWRWRDGSKRLHGIVIPLPPLQEVVSVKYADVTGASQTLDSSKYVVTKGAPSELTLAVGAVWPVVAMKPDAIAVQFKAGYGDAGSAVPEGIRTALALQVGHMRSMTQQNLFISRMSVPGAGDVSYTLGAGAEAVISKMVEQLLAGYRVWT